MSEPNLRQLGHEIANNIAVISMGLNCLPGIRETPSEFNQVLEMMEANMNSLKSNIKNLLELQESRPPVTQE